VVQHDGHPDNLLVEAARTGDHAAFSELVARHRTVAIRVCQRFVGDRSRAEDTVQEAVLQAWLSLDNLRRPDRFGAWLIGIAIHICQSWSRYRADQTWSLEALLGGHTLPEPVDTEIAPIEVVQLRELGRRVRAAIDELPAGQRTAVALFYLGDLSHAEIAAALGIEAGAVKTRLHKARGRLRRSLLDLWNEEHMTTQPTSGTDLVDVSVEDVRVVSVPETGGERCIVLLTDNNADRLLPIWVGRFEGDSIAIALLRAETRRPLTYAFTAQLLQASGARVREVHILRLVDETFYAEVTIEGPVGRTSVEARPSDAIALALETSVPIRVSLDVMQRAGLTRAQLAEKSVPSRGARERADQIRERVTQPRAAWSASTLF
jgi:RNA polymerase sigma factor (sigma-70 family)